MRCSTPLQRMAHSCTAGLLITKLIVTHSHNIPPVTTPLRVALAPCDTSLRLPRTRLAPRSRCC
eukprot:4932592-Pleurochrysis_carterae.AAC.1